MKRLTMSLAALALAAPAAAQTNDLQGDYVRTRDLTGQPIYTENAAYDEGAWTQGTWDGVGTGWNNIGEIEDVVLDTDGKLAGIVAEVGGFLDIADKHVFLEGGDFRVIRDGEDDYVVLTRWNEEQLEELEDIDEGWWE